MNEHTMIMKCRNKVDTWQAMPNKKADILTRVHETQNEVWRKDECLVVKFLY
jgi:hypothetical protein